jgi:hypothetical protein
MERQHHSKFALAAESPAHEVSRGIENQTEGIPHFFV